MANKKVSQLTSKPSVLVTDLFPIADPSTGQLYKTTISDLGTAIGSGVSSVNGLVGAVVLDTDDIQELVSPTNKWFTDTRARAAVSASSPLAYNSGTGVFSIPAATSSQNGYLTSTDWSIFNGKLDPSTAASTYVPYTGATGDVNLGSNNITAGIAIVNQVKAVGSGGLSLNSNNGTQVANLGAGGGANITFYGGLTGTSASFSGDVTLSGTNPRLYLTDTDNNPDYFISNTDGTFTVYDVTNSTSRFTIGTTGNGTFGGNLTVGSIIKSGGTSSQFLKADGSVDSSTYALDSAVVHNTGNETVAGQKTFSSSIFGTSASFSGTVGAAYVSISASSGGNGLYITHNSSYNSIVVTQSGAGSAIYATGKLTVIGTAYISDQVTFGASSFLTNLSQTITLPTSSGTLALTSQLSSYLPLSGGTLTGDLTITTGGSTTITNNGTNPIFDFIRTNNATTPTAQINFKTSQGTVRWQIGTNQAVGAGFEVNEGNGTANRFYIAAGGAATFSSDVTVSNLLTINGSSSGQNLRLNSKDNLGDNWVGFYQNNGTRQGYLGYGFSGSNVFEIYQEANEAILFSTAATERMRITSGGQVLIGTTSDNSNKFRVSASSNWTTEIINNNASNQQLFTLFTYGSTGLGSIQGNGSVVSYYSTSDYRLKEDLKPINGLEIVNKINVYDYKWKSQDSRMDGVLAHELAEVLPYAVSGVKNGEQMQQVDYSKIVPVMVQAIKELKAKIETLENK